MIIITGLGFEGCLLMNKKTVKIYFNFLSRYQHFIMFSGLVLHLLLVIYLKFWTKKSVRNMLLFEPHREKTGFLPMRKQRRRSASR